MKLIAQSDHVLNYLKICSLRIISTMFVSYMLLSCSQTKKTTNNEAQDEYKTSLKNTLKINKSLIDNTENHQKFEISKSSLSAILVKEYSYDLDKDGQMDKVKLFDFEEYANDPGDFQRIRIELSNGNILDEFNLGIRNNLSMPKLNEIESDLISIVQYKTFTFLMTYGWYFASEPSELTIFEFSTGIPRRIFTRNFEIENFVLKDDIICTGVIKYKQAGSSKNPSLLKLTIKNNELNLVQSAPN